MRRDADEAGRAFRLPLRAHLHDGLSLVRGLAPALLLLVAILGWAQDAWGALPVLIGVVAGMSLAIVGLHVVAGAVLRWVRVVRVGPEGLTATTFFGRRRTVAWEAIEAVEFEGSGAPAYDVVSVRGERRRLYVPSLLERDRAFEEAVLRYAGEGHPYGRYIAGEPAQ